MSKALLVKRKLGKNLKLLICTVTHIEGETGGTPWHGNAWIGKKVFDPEDEYLYDSELPEAPYAGPGFTWLVRCPVNAWHFAFSVLDQEGHLVLRAIEFIAPMVNDNGVVTALDLELDMYQLTDGEVIVVDQEEMEEALRIGMMSEEEGAKVRAECEALETALKLNLYPWPDLDRPTA